MQTVVVHPSPEVFLPRDLPGHAIFLREQNASDRSVIRDLYISTREGEMQAVTGWSAPQKRAFLMDQAQLQALHYATYYADAQFLVIEYAGDVIGRLYLFHNNPNDLRIVDICFFPAWCGRGLGTQFLKQVQAYAQTMGKSCSIHVEMNNPARHLYDRLGFGIVAEKGPYLLMQWPNGRA